MSTATAIELGIGLHWAVPMAAYLALDAMSASRLEKVRRSPLQYRHSLQEDDTTSDALERGTALHMALLEPEYFEGHYVVLGQCDGVKKDGDRCSYQGLVYRGGGSYCKTHDPMKGVDPDPEIVTLKEPDYQAVLGMRDAVLAHPRARTLFEGRGGPEITGVWEDQETGVLCKVRPDRLVERAGMHVAVKSTRDAAPWAFPRDAENRGYFRSLALYRRGLRALGWPYQATAVLAVESTAPFDLVCYLPDEAELDGADREVTRLLRQYRTCLETDTWPGYQAAEDGFMTLRRPAWAKETNDDPDLVEV